MKVCRTTTRLVFVTFMITTHSKFRVCFIFNIYCYPLEYVPYTREKINKKVDKN